MKREEAKQKIEKIIEDKTRETLTDEKLLSILKEAYGRITQFLRKYCDLKEEYYSLVTLWILGTYLHGNFPAYPYLYLNAMKGSGKTRLLKIVALLSKRGEVLNSLTEAVLFREIGTLCIDEFESLSRKGGENLKELLNSAYKKGGKVKRMKKVKKDNEEKQEVESFEVYRPICIANIMGMDNVLSDRCIKLTLEKSDNLKIIRRMEFFDQDENKVYTKKLLFPLESVDLCIVKTLQRMYQGWDEYLDNWDSTKVYTPYILHNYTLLYTTIYNTKLNGRELELSFPLLILAYMINKELYQETLTLLERIMAERREEDILESRDVALIDFVSQEVDDGKFISIKELTKKFKEFLQNDDIEVNPQWIGAALKRLVLIRRKERRNYGVCVILDINKAQEKIKMFK